MQKIIGPYDDSAAVCQDYDPRAAEVARRLAEAVSTHLSDIVVEHIGSTAVPGCSGKGIVDLMVLYPDRQLEAVKALLDALGFERQTSRDPFPEERPMRVGSLKHDGNLFYLHAHIISASSLEAGEMRTFRDLLRTDADLRAAYVARKRQIIESGITDSVDYSIAKGEFVRETLGWDAER
jgi:GrpB-like predicted nucleotidyltransferase (UPF0157 family)